MCLALSSGSQVDSITNPFHTLNLNRTKVWWSACFRRGHSFTGADSHRKMHRVSQLWSCLQNCMLLWADIQKMFIDFSDLVFLNKWMPENRNAKNAAATTTKKKDVISWFLFKLKVSNWILQRNIRTGTPCCGIEMPVVSHHLGTMVKHLTAFPGVKTSLSWPNYLSCDTLYGYGWGIALLYCIAFQIAVPCVITCILALPHFSKVVVSIKRIEHWNKLLFL